MAKSTGDAKTKKTVQIRRDNEAVGGKRKGNPTSKGAIFGIRRPKTRKVRS